jgi:hypothetical protein
MQTGPLTTSERRLLGGVLALVALAIAGPDVAQHVDYHAFADRRLLWGVPCAGDVLSNLAFAVAALAGAWHLAHAQLHRVQRSLGVVACAGLLLTAAGSSWYHWQPDAAGLLVDRLSMTVAFAGVLGIAACRISERAGIAVAALIAIAAPVSLAVFAASGNLLPWAVLQGGGLVLLLVLAAMPTGNALPVRWGWVVAAYAVAKLLELQDHLVWELTGQLVSGHSLKHVVAALAVAPLFTAWRARGAHNAAKAPLQAA